MNQQRPSLAQTAGQPRGEPEAVVMAELLGDGQVTVSPGKVEIGQGIVTALAQIAADELDVDIVARADGPRIDGRQPQRGRHLGQPFRCSSPAARCGTPAPKSARSFLQPASDRLGVEIDALEIEDGTISGPGNVRTSYWELADEVSLDRDATPGVTPKTASRRALAGHSVQRIDIPDKVFARPRFIHDRALAGHAAWPRAAAGAIARQNLSN